MEEQKIIFLGKKIKEIQEQYMTDVSDLYDALKEYETEVDYLSVIWKGNAADLFFAGDKKCREQLGCSMQRTEQLMMALIQSEKVFEQGEREILSMVGETLLWKT